MANSQEKLDAQQSASLSEKGSSKPQLSGTKEIKKGAESVLNMTEGSESSEDGGESMGNVSEATGEDAVSPSQGGGSGGKTMTTDEIEQLRAKLLASAPPQALMMKQIQKSLTKEVQKLEKQFDDLVSNPQQNPAEFVEVVSKMRQISVYFESMLNATYEYIKHLWLKIVHGI